MSQTAPFRHEAWHEPQDAGTTPPGGPSIEQAESVAAWLRWHAVELVGVVVPLALALAVSVWFIVLAAPAAALWAVHEARHARQRAQIRAAARKALTGPATREGGDQ